MADPPAPPASVPGSQEKADTDVSAQQFASLFEALSRWGKWGRDDERGALHLLSPERVAAAAMLVRDGVSVSLSLPVNTHAGVHNPRPADHHMTALAHRDAGSSQVSFIKDYVGLDYHNEGHTHIDALSHVAYQGSLYNARPDSSVSERGAEVNSIEVLKDGLLGRAALLDIPRTRGVPWLEPGEHVYPNDITTAEREQGVVVSEGDVLLVRTGHARRLAELGPWNTAAEKAGLHPTTMSLIAERGVAALGSDGNNDTAPSTTEGVDFPIHVLAITALGIHLLDYLQLEDVGTICESRRRWEFLLVAAPLRIIGGTGSPLNPIAVF